jgi:ATP-dependent DNA helicase MPH1
MASDDYFSDDQFNDADFQQLDAIEAAHFSPGKKQPPKPQDDSFDDLSFDVDEGDLNQLDAFIQDSYQRIPPSKTVQTTLFGQIIRNDASGSKPKPQIQRTSTAKPPSEPKEWDFSKFYKDAMKPRKSAKGKGKETNPDDEEELEFEQFPSPRGDIPSELLPRVL